MIKILILVAAVATALWVWLTLESRTLYYPDRQILATPKSVGLPYEEVFLPSPAGKKLHGWFVPAAPKKGTLTVLLCHGNAGNVSHRLEKIAKLHALDLNVLIFDYEGYGQSEGKPSEQATYQDGAAFYANLIESRQIPPSRIVLYGESLGCAVAVQLATERPAAALILESPFTSTMAMGKRIFPYLPIQWMVRYKYDSLAKIRNVKTPLLVLHSPDDEIVPFSMGQELFDAAREPKWMIALTGGHNDGYAVSGEDYTAAITEFLRSFGPKQGMGKHG